MFSIVIPTFNEEKYLPNLINDLQIQTFRDFEIIIADAGSKDKTREIAQNNGIKVVEGGLPAIARNNGAKIAKFSWLLFLDSDVRITPNFLKESVSQIQQKNLSVATAYFDTKGKNIVVKITYTFSNFTKYIFQKTMFPFATGECIFCDAKIFHKLRGFNTKYVVGEDVEFVQRAAKKGYKFRTLNIKFKPSSRRLDKYGVFRIIIGSIIAIILAPLQGQPKVKRIVNRMYGGWGKW